MLISPICNRKGLWEMSWRPRTARSRQPRGWTRRPPAPSTERSWASSGWRVGARATRPLPRRRAPRPSQGHRREAAVGGEGRGESTGARTGVSTPWPPGAGRTASNTRPPEVTHAEQQVAPCNGRPLAPCGHRRRELAALVLALGRHPVQEGARGGDEPGKDLLSERAVLRVALRTSARTLMRSAMAPARASAM